VPRIVAIILSIILAIALVSGVVFFIVGRVEHLLQDFPLIKKQAQQNVKIIQSSLQQLFDLLKINMEELYQSRIDVMFEKSGKIVGDIFNATTGTIFKLFLMPVYIFLFLYYRTKFAIFIIKLTAEKNKKRTIKTLREISRVGARYMGGILAVVVILFFLNSFGLMIIGVDYAITLGVLSALFSFIPYFGTLLGGLVPLIYTLLTGDFPADPIKVVSLYLILNAIENNILTPNIVGLNVDVSPFFIILGLIASAMVWGIPGMLFIVPFLAILRIIFQNSDRMQPYAYLLGTGGTRKYAITLHNIKKRIGQE
jgi:predicted PurR-regulated permease PerM